MAMRFPSSLSPQSDFESCNGEDQDQGEDEGSVGNSADVSECRFYPSEDRCRLEGNKHDGKVEGIGQSKRTHSAREPSQGQQSVKAP